MNDAIKQAEALRALIRECVRFADWAAGQGIYPADGEPASVPEDFISDFLVRTDADGLGDFTDSVMALLPTAADLAGLADGTRVVVPVEASPDDIRAAGWAVAVHNDYRLNGEAHTFWLFTRGDICVKGEGRTDAEALHHVRLGIKILGDKRDHWKARAKTAEAALSARPGAKEPDHADD